MYREWEREEVEGYLLLMYKYEQNNILCKLYGKYDLQAHTLKYL